jgi:toxin ParE1/3/4
MNLSVLAAAKSEIAEVVKWYDLQRTGLSDDFLDELNEVFAAIQQDPLRFASVETAEVQYRVRRALLRRFPYMIVFRVLDDVILVAAVSHTSRKPNYWKKRLQ